MSEGPDPGDGPSPAPARTRFVTAVEDSGRWRHVEHRADDIVISTPPKSGTTWMQGIVSSLLWPAGDPPGRLHERSPWVDARFDPAEVMGAQVEAIAHRRFLKTHSPATALPRSGSVRYLAVYRNPADAFVSWGNHRAGFKPELVDSINAGVADEPVRPFIKDWDGDWPALFEEWSEVGNPFTHLASWWPRRTEENVLLIHYTNLTADLEAGVRQVAEFCDIELPESAWPEVVARCRLEAMRERARVESVGRASMLRDGPDRFYYRGGVGRGARLLDAEMLERIWSLAPADLDAEALTWLMAGDGWAE